MLGLPKTTELKKQLPKNAIYAKFQMNTAAKEKIDADISRITIVNEVTAEKINVDKGEQVGSFFVMHVALKRRDFDEKNIITLSKLIPQKMLMVLEFNGKIKITTFLTKLMQTDWKEIDSYKLELKGLNLDKVWENIIVQIGDVIIEQGNTLEQQIVSDDKKQKLLKEIERLEKMAGNEKQPKKKFEIVQKMNKMKKGLEG